MNYFSNTHPSNIFKYCPKCGNKGFNFIDKKKFECHSCGFTFFINAATAAVGIIEAPDGKIVIIKRKFDPKAGFYDLPGGFVDCLERAEEGLKREILEELGATASSMKFLASFPNEYVYEGISYFTCDLAFTCTIDNIDNLKPADDVAEAELIHPDQINFDLIAFPSIINILRQYISGK